MARGIVTCTGEQINIGDKVRTSHGTVIRVEGAAIMKAYYNAEACTKVSAKTPTTAEVNAKRLKAANAGAKRRGEKPVKAVSGGQSDGDCIVWGG